VYVAIRERITVLGAGMHLVTVVDRAPGKRLTERLAHRRSGIRVLFGKATVELSAPEGLRHLIAEVGVSQIVMGADYPFPWTKTGVDHILTTPGLSDAERVAILGETAANLLAIKPA
jgi:hypothetical protein